jgi:hypothetical protein
LSLTALGQLLVASCGGTHGPAPATGGNGARTLAQRREAHLFGLGEDAVPELASLWPALASRAAVEVTETLRVGRDGGVHCVHVVVAGDFAQEAFETWREAASSYDCEDDDEPRRIECRGEGVTLAIQSDAGEFDPDAAALDALAVEMGVPGGPSASAMACVEGVGVSRLASIDERLHRSGLLEPWHELHERLGVRRFADLRWTRSSERGDELSVRYAGDEEAFALAEEWARDSGFSGGDGVWRRVSVPLAFSLELRAGHSPEIELVLAREP